MPYKWPADNLCRWRPTIAQYTVAAKEDRASPDGQLSGTLCDTSPPRCRKAKGFVIMAISPFLTALGSEGPPADRAKDMDLYGWLIGSWEMDTVHHLDDGTIQKSTGEIHFGWVLEGRAIQDIWIRPKRPAPSIMYGTTLRIFDPGIEGWHIIWTDPLNQDYSRQIGRAEGKDIVQIGDDSRGLQTRWRFTEITADSFHWIGEERSSESDPWQVTYEHLARRTSS
jgi:hypothetical protein